MSLIAQVFAWLHQTITWTNVELSSVRSSDNNHLRAISLEIYQPSITNVYLKIDYQKFHSNLLGANGLKLPQLRHGWMTRQKLISLKTKMQGVTLTHCPLRDIEIILNIKFCNISDDWYLEHFQWTGPHVNTKWLHWWWWLMMIDDDDYDDDDDGIGLCNVSSAFRQQAIAWTNVDSWRSMSPYGITGPQWVQTICSFKSNIIFCNENIYRSQKFLVKIALWVPIHYHKSLVQISLSTEKETSNI